MARGRRKGRDGSGKDLSRRGKTSVSRDGAENSGMNVENSRQGEMMDGIESNPRAEIEGVMDKNESDFEGEKTDDNERQNDKTDKDDEELLPRKKAPGRPKITDPKQPHFCPFPN